MFAKHYTLRFTNRLPGTHHPIRSANFPDVQLRTRDSISIEGRFGENMFPLMPVGC